MKSPIMMWVNILIINIHCNLSVFTLLYTDKYPYLAAVNVE